MPHLQIAGALLQSKYPVLTNNRSQAVSILRELPHFATPAREDNRITSIKDDWKIMIDHLDHLVLTTADPDRCIHFYTQVLGMKLEHFIGGTPPVQRMALVFGSQKINIHVKGREFEPKAHVAIPGALDLCFIASCTLDEVMATLQAAGIPLVEGPVPRTGATGKIRSVYVRDPDLNLIEISEPCVDDGTHG